MELDYLVFHPDEAARTSLAIEKRQARDEGRDWDALEDAYESALTSLADDHTAGQVAAREFCERVQRTPIRAGFEYDEPDDLDEIRETRPDGPRSVRISRDLDLLDRVRGAWLGRCAGCLLGKPIEGWSSDRIAGYLAATDRDPLDRYLTAAVDDSVRSRYDVEPDGPFVENVEGMPRDDDIDYSVAGLAILSEHGLSVESADVARYWLENLPAGKTYTAERIAYRNLLEPVLPPRSGRRWNPYREAIGAQIRADPYGYVAIGRPEQAAELAWRDARVSHVKNGRYGAMWVAAMLAAAPAVAPPRRLLEIGLAEIPAQCRLAEAIGDVLAWDEQGWSYEEAVSAVHERWDEELFFEWVHVIPNAMLVAIGLLWGEDDFGTAISRAVAGCFDTDCNGATVGSIMGMAHGAEAIPERWTAPIDGTVHTALVDRQRQSLAGLVRETRDCQHRFR